MLAELKGGGWGALDVELRTSGPVEVANNLLVAELKIDSDVRAFRVTREALYDKEFVPPPAFAKGAGTLILLDFAAGKGKQVPDLSGHKRHGTIVDGEWVDAAERK